MTGFVMNHCSSTVRTFPAAALALVALLAAPAAKASDQGPTEPADIENALSEYLERPRLTSHEERVVASHESGHAVCALFCEHAPPIDRISIRGDLAGALGFVQYADPAHRDVVTRSPHTVASSPEMLVLSASVAKNGGTSAQLPSGANGSSASSRQKQNQPTSTSPSASPTSSKRCMTQS
jgi:hypothetical protein